MESAKRSRRYTEPLVLGVDFLLILGDASNRAKLHFLRPLPNYRHLRIKGVQDPTIQTTATSSIDVNAEWLVVAAALECLKGDPNLTDAQRDTKADLELELAKLEKSPVGNTQYGKKIYWTKEL